MEALRSAWHTIGNSVDKFASESLNRYSKLCLNFRKMFLRISSYISQNGKLLVPVTGLLWEFIDERHEKQEIRIYGENIKDI